MGARARRREREQRGARIPMSHVAVQSPPVTQSVTQAPHWNFGRAWYLSERTRSRLQGHRCASRACPHNARPNSLFFKDLSSRTILRYKRWASVPMELQIYELHLTPTVAQPHSYLEDITLPPEVECYVHTLTDIADALGVDNLSFSS